MTSHRAILDHTYYFSHFILSSPYLLGFSGVLTQEGIVPHFMGIRGEVPMGNVAKNPMKGYELCSLGVITKTLENGRL